MHRMRGEKRKVVCQDWFLTRKDQILLGLGRIVLTLNSTPLIEFNPPIGCGESGYRTRILTLGTRFFAALGRLFFDRNRIKFNVRRPRLCNQAEAPIRRDVRGGIGLAPLSFYIEAQACQGENAAYVMSTLQSMLRDAIRASGRTDDILVLPQRPGSSVG